MALTITSDNFINLRNGRFDSSTREQLKSAFSSFDADATNNLVVHFHGGLVNEDRAMALADRLLPIYRQTNVAYPMFFVWESGLLETIRNNGTDILNEDFFQKLLKRALQFAAGKVLQGPGEKGLSVTPVGRAKVDEEIDKVAAGQPAWQEMTDQTLASTSELSQAEAQQFKDFLEGDPSFMTEVQLISNSVEPPDNLAQSRGLSTAGSKKTLMSPEVLADVQREKATGTEGTKGFISAVRLVKGAVVVVARTISRFRNKRDHGFRATVVEEILREFYVSAVGREIWGQMKKDTADAFQPNRMVFGGSAFLSELAERMANPPRVLLVGHSAGAEYMCNTLKHAGDFLPSSFQFDVVLMAPACRTSVFADTVAHHGSRMRNFRCFTMRDDLEKADELVPVLYPHSLLYFISGVLEDEADAPVLGMERYLTGQASHYQKPATGIPAFKTFVTGGATRINFAVSNAGPGLATNSISHGGFDNTDDVNARATVDSVCHILRSGF